MNRGWTRAMGPLMRASAWNTAAPTTPAMPIDQAGRRARASSSRTPPPRSTVEAALRWNAVPTALLTAPRTAKTTASPIMTPVRTDSTRAAGSSHRPGVEAGRGVEDGVDETPEALGCEFSRGRGSDDVVGEAFEAERVAAPGPGEGGHGVLEAGCLGAAGHRRGQFQRAVGGGGEEAREPLVVDLGRHVVTTWWAARRRTHPFAPDAPDGPEGTGRFGRSLTSGGMIRRSAKGAARRWPHGARPAVGYFLPRRSSR